MPFPQDPIRIEFVLSFEDWLEARGYRPQNEKERKTFHADYLLFSAERRSFDADGHGWIYTFSGGKAEHSWTDMMGLGMNGREDFHPFAFSVPAEVVPQLFECSPNC